MSADKEIKLKSNDEQVFTIKESAVKRSRLVEGILADYEDNTEVPLPDVNGKTLKRIVDYLIHYENSEPKAIPKPLKNSNLVFTLDGTYNLKSFSSLFIFNHSFLFPKFGKNFKSIDMSIFTSNIL